MQEFPIRVISMMMIIGILFGYNTKLEERSKDEEIARLNMLVEIVQEEQANDSLYKDGTYMGEAEGYGGNISLEVLVENGEMTKINILSAEYEDEAYLIMAEDIIYDILQSQGIEVDSISGATFSSVGIRDAVEQALKQAVK